MIKNKKKFSMSKRFAIVDLMGGLGNQIYQVSLAKYLKDLGCDVILNPFWYENQKNFKDGTSKRELVFDLEIFNFKILSKSKYVVLEIINKIIMTRLFSKIRKKLILPYKLHEGQSLNEENITYINRFSGYWQIDPDIRKNLSFLKTSIINNYENLVEDEKIKSNILLHIRKGDYQNIDEILPDRYFQLALEKLNSYENKKYDIFTDQTSVDMENNLYKNASNVYTSSHPLSDFLKMLNYKTYIISNSSYSYMAALLSNYESPTVVYPSPWFKNMQHNPLFDSEWKKIEYLK